MNDNKKKATIEKGIRGQASGEVSGIVVQKNGVIRAARLKKIKSGSTK